MVAIATNLRSLDNRTCRFIFWLTFALNFYIAIVAITSVSNTRTPLCYKRHRCNGTEFNNTLSEIKSKINVHNRSGLKFWVVTFFGLVLNCVWICSNMALSLNLYKLNVSRRCVLNMMTFIHLMFMLTIYVINLARHRDSPNFIHSLLCQSGFIILSNIVAVFYVECLSEYKSQNQKEVEQVKYCNVDSKCQNITV